MRRRTALATAGAIAIVLLAAAAAATNLGLLRVTTDTGQVGQLNPTELATTEVARQATPVGTPTAGDDGGAGPRAGTTAPAGVGKPGDDRSGDRLGRAGHEGTRTHERFEGRADDD
jgi:hypothetical protein